MSGTVNRAPFPARSLEDRQRKMYGMTEAEIEERLKGCDDADRLFQAMCQLSDAQEELATVAEKHGLGPIVVHEERRERARQGMNRAKYIIDAVRLKLKNGVIVAAQ